VLVGQRISAATFGKLQGGSQKELLDETTGYKLINSGFQLHKVEAIQKINEDIWVGQGDENQDFYLGRLVFEEFGICSRTYSWR